jgi:hypothetical protein
MIEIKEHDPSNDAYITYYYELFIDGVAVDEKDAKVSPTGIDILNPHIGDRLTAHRLCDIPLGNLLQLRYKFEGLDILTCISVSSPSEKSHGTLSFLSESERYTLSFSSSPNLTTWKRAYSYNEYCSELLRISKTINDPDAELKLRQRLEWDNDCYAFEINFPILRSSQLTLSSEIERSLKTVRLLHSEVEKSLSGRIHDGSVAAYFKFPADVQVACEQYLIYFIQFLQDLGISATSELKHEAGKVLFNVTPTDSYESLDKIRVALEIYLRLPSNPVSYTQGEGDIDVQRLVATIYHLKSQLALSQAMLQAKDATIQAQQLTIHHQRRLVGGEVIIESLLETNTHSQDETKESLLGGVVSITKYKGKGFEVNLPKIFRCLKKMFADNK